MAKIASDSEMLKKFIEGICQTSILLCSLNYCCKYMLFNNQHIEILILLAALTAYISISIPPAKTYSFLSKRLRIALFLMITIFTLTTAVVIKDNIRLQAHKYSIVFHDHPRYWTNALKFVINGSRLKIAHTYGMDKLNHWAFIAPFFGARLQNEVCYVSPLSDGRTPVYHPDYIDKEPYCYDSWVKRLREKKVTHLLCFAPRCKELEWARSHPESFKMLVGNNVWGFFEIR